MCGVMLEEEEIHSEPPFQERESVRYEEKSRIGKRAAELIEDGDNIILDSGTTTLHIAKSIMLNGMITAVSAGKRAGSMKQPFLKNYPPVKENVLIYKRLFPFFAAVLRTSELML